MKPGQNTMLPTTTVRFTADSAAPFDLSALVTDSTLRALSSEDFVFYNQPHTHGVRMGVGGIDIDLDAVHPDAHAVLCIASVDPLAAPGTVFTQVTATLHDHTGAAIAVLDINCTAAETAVISWELYRRAGQWKVRAVGQGYSGGLAALITRHGVDVDEPAEPTQAPGAGSAPAEDITALAPIEPLDPNHILERFEMITEDAARSSGALIAAREFAEARLDTELTAAVSDPATRNSPQAAEARAGAQRRHDTVIDEAQTRYRLDSAHLERELRTISPELPRAFADWNAPAWTSNRTEPAGANGLRIGELSAPHHESLRIPVCLPLPLMRPLRIMGPDTPATAAVTTAAVIRMLSADPNLHLDVVDLSGTLHGLTGGLARRRGGTAITQADHIHTHLESRIASAELATLDPESSAAYDARARLVVLNNFPYGYDDRHLPAIRVIAEHGPALGISLAVVADDASALEAIHPDLPPRSYTLPASDGSDWYDPWTSNHWNFTPDRTPTDTDHLARVLNLAAGQ
ncbi:TerD family protein [Rhodococcus sp. Q]|uniref:TerD family protein n=1 Tax=Rhodococcus sp. Q TaxID=2502252 RepID=UPI0010F90400|nr:TerD family protein [Rhodococcus sp. Q]